MNAWLVNALALVVLLGCAGCGRIAFEPRADAATICDPAAPFTSVTPLDSLNTTDGEGGIRLNADELVAYYHSHRGIAGYGQFITSRASRTDPFPLGVYTGVGGLFPSLSADELTLVYDGSDDIFASTRASVTDSFTGGQLLALIDIGVELQAMLSGNGRSLYFVRVAASFDLFVVPWPALTPERALTELNTIVDERIPVISADELTLYFARIDAGTNAIWLARRASVDEEFSGAIKVAELDTVLDEAPSWLSLDQCRLYFESNRVTGIDYDLYIAERQP